jgi:hypothetical protein
VQGNTCSLESEAMPLLLQSDEGLSLTVSDGSQNEKVRLRRQRGDVSHDSMFLLDSAEGKALQSKS